VSRIKEDTAIGIMYTGIFAIGGILASLFSHRIHIDLYHFVTGMVLGVEDTELWMMAFVAVFVLAMVILFFRHFQITTFDPVMAASIGIPVVALDYLLTTCTSLVVVSAVSIVGVILVVGLLVTPAATAYLLCDRLSRMLVLSAAFGITSVIGGLYLSTWIGNIATGPSIVIVGTFQFLVVLTVAPRYGLIADWLRRYRMVPQALIEDVLGCFRHNEGVPQSLQTVLEHVEAGGDQIKRAVRALQRQDLLRVDGDRLTLTSSGAHKARKLLRAHRLWETYLKHVGTPSEQLHTRAHKLEHVYDEATVDYLDDILGHPLRDPHGAEIPEDFVHLVPGTETKASLMREGHSATIVTVGPEAKSSPLKPGMHVTAGPRQDQGRSWSFQVSDNGAIVLDHSAADAVTVKLDSEDAQQTHRVSPQTLA
jgi:manganese/iron transport system permease protein/iron/zinc/copper transport system permease protein